MDAYYTRTGPASWYDQVSGNTVYWTDLPGAPSRGRYTVWIGNLLHYWGRLPDGSYGWIPSETQLRELQRGQREASMKAFVYLAIVMVIFGISVNLGAPGPGAAIALVAVVYFAFMDWLSNRHPLIWAAMVTAAITSFLHRHRR